MPNDRAYLALPQPACRRLLADLDVLIYFAGPIWSYFPIMEIQSSIGWVLELPVEGLAGDFLGV